MSSPSVKNGKSSFSDARIRRGLFIGVMLSVAIIQFLVFYVYVNFNSILMAFRVSTSSGVVYGFDNFTRFFKEFRIPEFELSLALKNTLLLFVVGTVIGLPVSLLFSYYLYKKILFAKFFRVIFFLPSIISGAVLVGIFKYCMAGDGPVNTILSFITGRVIDLEWVTDDALSMKTILFYVFWTGFGSNIVLFTGAIHRIPIDVIEYAKIDGVTMTREFFQIILPLIWPTFSMLLVFATSGLFTNSGPILLFTQGQYKTMTIGYYIFMQVQRNSFEYPSAIGLIFTCIGFPLVLIVKWALGKITEDVEY